MAKTKEMEKLGITSKASKTKDEDATRSKKSRRLLGAFGKKSSSEKDAAGNSAESRTYSVPRRIKPEDDGDLIPQDDIDRMLNVLAEDNDYDYSQDLSTDPEDDYIYDILEDDDDFGDIDPGEGVVVDDGLDDQVDADLSAQDDGDPESSDDGLDMANIDEMDLALARYVVDFNDKQLWAFCIKNYPNGYDKAFAMLKKLTQKIREDEVRAEQTKTEAAARNTRPVPPPPAPAPIPMPMPMPAPASYYGGFPIEGFGEAFLYFSREEKEFMLTSDFWAAKLYGTKWDKVYAWYENGVPVRIATEREREMYLPKSTVLKT